MQEQARQYYLQQLGVVSYRPRWPLPGAAQSVLLNEKSVDQARTAGDVEELTEVKGLDASVASESTASKKSANVNSLAGLVDDTGLQTRSGKNGNKATTTATEIEKAEKQVVSQLVSDNSQKGYRLTIWRLANEILIVDSTQPNSGLPTQRLLNNIVLALGYSTKDLSAAESLRWPLPNVASITPPTEREGRELLHAYYEGQIASVKIKSLLLMGESAAYFSLSEESVSTAEVKQLFGETIVLEKLSDQYPLNAILVPSLASMLQQPLIKKITWKAIQSLRIDR